MVWSQGLRVIPITNARDDRHPPGCNVLLNWRIKRGFNDIKREVQQELHNDEVMRELREAGQQLKDDTQAINRDIRDATESVVAPPQDNAPTAAAEDKPAARPAPTAAEQKAE